MFVELTIGATSSGKSTYAHQRVRESKGTVVNVNRDDIRRTLFQINSWKQYTFSSDREALVTAVQRQMAISALTQGKSVIVSDTNLKPEFRETWVQLAKEHGAEYKETWFPVALEELKERNAKRGGWSVHADVVERMFNQFHEQYSEAELVNIIRPTKRRQYVGDTSLPNAVIVDVDGTIAEKGDRNPFDWMSVEKDTPRWNVIRLVELLYHSGVKIIIASGRDNVCREQTINWLQKFGVPYDLVVMRGEDLDPTAEDYQPDQRRDDIIKEELFWNKIAPRYNVLHTIDDRNQVVAMWRNLGIECIQVQEGDF